MSALRSQRALAIAIPLAVEGVALGRSIILARAIGPEELGRAMMLALVLRLVEMISDLGVERLLIQAPEGATEQLQARLQGALILRGGLLVVMLLALSPLLALSFPDGPATLTYAAMALIPGIRAFLHLDYRRIERKFRYEGQAKVELGASTAMLFVLGTLLLLGLDDHRVLPVALIGQAAVQVLLSHWFARRRWRLSFERAGLLRVWHFGAPLTVNAGLMFLTLQADRFIVAKFWDWSDVAIYGTVAQLSLLPAQMYGRAASSLLLPGYGEARAQGRLGTVAMRALWRAAGLAMIFSIGFGLLSPWLVGVVYGAEMTPSQGLAIALAAAASIRIARTPLSVLAVATARTKDPARANSWRALALVPGLALAAMGAPLGWFAASAAFGEAAAYIRGWQLARPGTLNAPPKDGGSDQEPKDKQAEEVVS